MPPPNPAAGGGNRGGAPEEGVEGADALPAGEEEADVENGEGGNSTGGPPLGDLPPTTVCRDGMGGGNNVGGAALGDTPVVVGRNGGGAPSVAGAPATGAAA